MPTTSNTNTDIVQGPRKRRPTERVTENGDPLARKKAKTTPRTSINARAIPIAPQPSIEEIPNPIRRPQPLLQHAHQSSGATDSGDKEANTAGPLASSTDAIEIDNRTDDDDDDNAWSDECNATTGALSTTCTSVKSRAVMGQE
ncbi:hypothetical protein EDB89DRAFT_2076115 [Lactarius sanguifluus]|nr:hypothetical protein EDB89DRAFT_2076115 [Lactarius sanguifluus]